MFQEFRLVWFHIAQAATTPSLEERPTAQWPFQDPRLEVPTTTIYKAYFSGLNFREYPPKIWPEIWY